MLSESLCPKHSFKTLLNEIESYQLTILNLTTDELKDLVTKFTYALRSYLFQLTREDMNLLST